MSWCDRRFVIAGLGALALLPACGFSPAYGPGGAAGRLQGQVALDDPGNRAAYMLHRRIEDRLGHAPSGRYRLSTSIDTSETDLGTTSTGTTTRYQVLGQVDIRLLDTASGAVLLEDRVDSFTGYSATGSNVATLASERDAEERLMTLLADRIVDRLIAVAPDLPA
ncbi:LPS assembly lipoprotein LptE [Roseivivax sediminis]|uniref:LPS-assembly lipoprotein n=1 Tax=Roseivivax sediminis TaxID=936889 RepID=A0A1I1UQI6_9RHOB|nr:LPS assembly lipoprotein LptE [Roseivivax sediminis]SFD70250.1 LPS-assembly lipoprotein [Roseivivax sediminis]